MEMRVLVDRNWEGGVRGLLFGGCCFGGGVRGWGGGLGFAACGATSLTSAGHHRTAQKLSPARAGLLFLCVIVPFKSKLLPVRYHTKKTQPFGLRFCLFVIRLGFEPKTHSLEGCCSIQLSYRTSPSFVLKADAKIGNILKPPKFI